MKKMLFFSMLLIVLTFSSSLASNQAISIRVETSGTQSKLVKTILQDLCLENGYTVVDRENTGTIYYEQDLKNNPRYNSGTAVNSGNMIIATVILKVDSSIESQYFYDIGGSISGGYGNVDNTNYRTTLKYSVSSVELGTYSDVKTVTGSANDTDIYGRYEWVRGRYGEYSNAARTASIYDAAQNIIPDISAIASNLMNNYYNQTEGSYQPYPNPVPPSTTYNQSSSSSNQNSTTSYNQIAAPNNNLPPNSILFDSIENQPTLSSATNIVVNAGVNVKVKQHIDSSHATEIFNIENGTLIYANGTTLVIDTTQPNVINFSSFGQPGQKLKFSISDGQFRRIFYVQY